MKVSTGWSGGILAPSAALAVSLSLAAAGAVAAPRGKPPVRDCVDGRTLAAMQMRIVQTELMVAGLSCRGIDRWAQTANTQRYNAFVTTYRPTLMNDTHRVLAKFFPTEQRLNDYLTRLANDSSQRSLRDIVVFCDTAAKIYDDVLSPTPVQLPSYSAALPISEHHGHKVCSQAQAPGTGGGQSAAPRPEAASQSIATLIAASEVSAPAGQSDGMRPIADDVSMVAAVKNPPVPRLKPVAP